MTAAPIAPSGQRTDARSQRRLRSEGRQELCHLRHRLAARGLVNSSVGGMVIRVAHPDIRRRLLCQAARHQPGRGREEDLVITDIPWGRICGRAGDHGGPPDETADPAPAARRQLSDPPAPRRDDCLHGGGLRGPSAPSA